MVMCREQHKGKQKKLNTTQTLLLSNGMQLKHPQKEKLVNIDQYFAFLPT
jgi:hypothetical protein